MDCLAGHKLLRKSGKVTQADEALKDKKIILFYFSAHWSPPCRVFTPILNDCYSVSFDFAVALWCLLLSDCLLKELVREEEPIEVIFISADQSPEEMINYMEESHADWLAVQHGAAFGKYG
jgi:nucleoredoxin